MTEHSFSIIAHQFHLRYITERDEDICPHKNLYMEVHGSIIHNHLKVEVTQSSVDD